MFQILHRHGGPSACSNREIPGDLHDTRDKSIRCCQVKICCPERMYSVTISMVLYHGLRVHDFPGEGALGPLSFILERQYIEQVPDNQQDQSTVNRTELQQN